MANARSIIERALRKIGSLGRGQNLSDEEAQTALSTLNGLLGTLSAESGAIFNNTRETFSLTGAQSYSIGPGGDFDTQRPNIIVALYTTIGNIDYPVSQIGAEDYAEVSYKQLGGVAPDVFYYESNTPLSRIFLYPKPPGGYTITIYSLKAITSFADLTTDYILPEGAEDMMVYNLAIRLCPDYEKPVTQELLMFARQSKAAFENYNRRNDYPTSGIDIPTIGGVTGNIFSGYFK